MMGWFFAILFFFVALFLGIEHIKKFNFVQSFMEVACDRVLTLYYGGAVYESNRPGMYFIRIHGEEPFELLIGFEIYLIFGKGVDIFGYADSTPTETGHEVIISTYLGRNSVVFKFLVTNDMRSELIEVIDPKKAPELTPQIVCKPHWWQRLGLYG